MEENMIVSSPSGRQAFLPERRRWTVHVSQSDISIIPQPGTLLHVYSQFETPGDVTLLPTDGFFIRYDLKFKYLSPGIANIFDAREDTEVSHVQISPRHNSQLSGGMIVDMISRDFLGDWGVSDDVLQDIIAKVEQMEISLANYPQNAAPKLLFIYVDILCLVVPFLALDGYRFSYHFGGEEDSEDEDYLEDYFVGDDDEDMARVVSLSVQEDYLTRSPIVRFLIKSLGKAKFEAGMKEINPTCTVCFEEYLEGEEVMMMPCKHIYHGGCILRWLEQSNFCPLCRFIVI